MAVPVPHTWTAGDNATSTAMQTLTDTGLWNLGSATSTSSRKPFCQVRQTVAQSIATSGSWQAVTFDTEDADYDGGHSTVTNTDRYTAATAGWYMVSGGCGFAANATGRRGVRYTVNGTAVNGSATAVPATAALATMVPGRTMPIFLNVGDILRLEAIQESTGALNTAVAAEQQPSMTVLWFSN